MKSSLSYSLIIINNFLVLHSPNVYSLTTLLKLKSNQLIRAASWSGQGQPKPSLKYNTWVQTQALSELIAIDSV